MKDSVIIGHMLRLGDQAAPIDAAALAAARSKSGSAQEKLRTYMECHHLAGDMMLSWGKVSLTLRWLLRGWAGVALVCGALAAMSAFAQGQDLTAGAGRVNVFWLLASLLGLNCISLILWIGFVWRAPGAPFSLSHVMAHFLTWAMGKSSIHKRAIESYGATHLSGALGRWSVGAVSHGLWCLYLIAGLLCALLLLTVQSYSFVWETTLLSAEDAVALIGWLSAPLNIMGVAVPSDAMIVSAQTSAVQDGMSFNASVWARFCLAVLFTYGVVPRALLWAVSAARAKALKTAINLDPAIPFFASILARIYQPEIHHDVVDADRAPTPKHVQNKLDSSPDTRGLLAKNATLIGWEIEAFENSEFQPDQVAGFFDRPEALKHALDAVSTDPIVLAVSALNTPDRGVESALKPFSGLTPDRRSVWIMNVSDLRTRAPQDDVTRRLGDWWSLLTRLGFDPSSIQVDGGAT